MKKSVFVLMLWLIFAAEGTASEKTVSIATSAWEPYCGKFLPNYGIEPEIVSAAYARSGYKAEFRFMAWVSALEEVRNGVYDAVTSASFTKERAKDYLYSDSYMESPVVFYKRKDSQITWRRLEDLKPYKIGVVRGYAYSPEFDKTDFLQKRISKTEMVNIRKLLLKQADLIVMDRFVGHYLIHKKLYKHERDILEVLSPPLFTDKLHLMFSKKTPDVLKKTEAFNSGLKKIREDGTLVRILEKHGL
ncbi:transporter substrate-binding domain-containing protein [Desulfococcaceae bacterium HSG8]|nr:transporter substrate-binding domain-containing protein [Desulfococcaceae bacterium HSG8]